MLYFNPNGQPIDFVAALESASGGAGAGGQRQTSGDTGGTKPVQTPGAQVTPSAIKTAVTPTPQMSQLSAPQGGATIDPQMINSIRQIVQNRQYASPAQQAGSPVYQDPNLQVGPANPTPQQQAEANAGAQVGPANPDQVQLNLAQNQVGNPSDFGPSSSQIMQSQGMGPATTADTGGGPMGGSGGGMGLGMAVGGMLQNAAKQDQANAQHEMELVSKGAQTGTLQPQIAQFGSINLGGDINTTV